MLIFTLQGALKLILTSPAKDTFHKEPRLLTFHLNARKNNCSPTSW